MVKDWRDWTRRWPQGKLLVLLSVGLHGLLLALPLYPSAPPEDPIILISQAEPEPLPEAEVVEVISLPAPQPKAPAPLPRSHGLGTTTPPTDQGASPIAQPSPPAPPMLEEENWEPELDPEPDPEPEAEVANWSEEPDSETPTVPPGLVYNDQGKALTGDMDSFLTWYNEQNWAAFDPAPLPNPKALDTIQVIYDEALCLTPAPFPGRFEIIVQPNGTLARPPRLLATTGYDALDEQARTQATQQDFSAFASVLPNPTVYWLPVEVVYNATDCQP